jgi:hypothetical protein
MNSSYAIDMGEKSLFGILYSIAVLGYLLYL